MSLPASEWEASNFALDLSVSPAILNLTQGITFPQDRSLQENLVALPVPLYSAPFANRPEDPQQADRGRLGNEQAGRWLGQIYDGRGLDKSVGENSAYVVGRGPSEPSSQGNAAASTHEPLFHRGLSWFISTFSRRPPPPAIVGIKNGNPADNDRELLELRSKVESDQVKILGNDVGGAMGRADVYRQVNAILRRIERANGMDPGVVSLHLGATFMPNGFTTITDAEIEFLKKRGQLRASFRNSNVFLSRGLIESMLGHSDATIAFVLAHELAHNRLGHLKSLPSSFMMLGHLLEFEADAEALTMIARAGYDPRQALDFLDLISERTEALKKRYPLLHRQQSQFHKLLSRWKDIHPDSAMRRANLEDRLSEALELYESSPWRTQPADRLDRVSRMLAGRPLRDSLTKFESKLTAIVRDAEVSFYDRIVAIEKLIAQKMRRVKKSSYRSNENPYTHAIPLEEQLIVENSFRDMARGASDLQDLNNLYQMHDRLGEAYAAKNFPSLRAYDSIVAQQILKVRAQIGRAASLEKLRGFVGAISAPALRSLSASYINRISSKPELDSTLEFLGNHASALNLVGRIGTSVAQKLARVLLAKAMDLAAQPQAPPDERLAQAIEYLQSKLPTVFLNAPPPLFYSDYLSTQLKAEIVDLYFTGKLGEQPRWKLLDMMLLLEGKSRAQIQSQKDGMAKYGTIHSEGIMEAWNNRYYTPLGMNDLDPERPRLLYESLHSTSLRLPNAAELMDILAVLPYETRNVNKDADFVIMQVPEAIAGAILRAGPERQEKFWEEATQRLLAEYREKRHLPDSEELFKGAMKKLNNFQRSVAAFSDSLVPMVSILRGTREALVKARASGDGVVPAEVRSQVADWLISEVVNVQAAKQIKMARNSKAGIVPTEFAALTQTVLELDRDFSSFNTERRVGTLGSAFYFAVTHDRDLLGLVSFIRSVWIKNNPNSWQGGGSDHFSAANRKLFAEAGLAEQFYKLPTMIYTDLTSGALGLIADSRTTPGQLLGASLALYLRHQAVDLRPGSRGLLLVDQSLAFLLVEEAARRIGSREEARTAEEFLLHAHDLDPLYLSYIARPDMRTEDGLYGRGVGEMIRSELAWAIMAYKQPFRERDASVVRGLLEKIKQYGAWPADAGDQLVLLDWAGRVGDFDRGIDEQILQIARQNPRGFAAWVRRDERWRAWIGRKYDRSKGKTSPGPDHDIKEELEKSIERVLNLPDGTVVLPELRPMALKIARNPVSRAELYRILHAKPYGRRASHNYFREAKTLWHLGRAFLRARKYVSVAFLRKAVREASPDSRIVMVFEEISRVAQARTIEAEKRWSSNRWTSEDEILFSPGYLKAKRSWWRRLFRRSAEVDVRARWLSLSESERDLYREEYRAQVFGDALAAVRDLGDKYAAFIIPELGYILDSFPEPNRTRDDLIEDLAKARILTPEQLSIMEGYKSYRYPSPLRTFEKQFYSAINVKLGRLTPAERVDLVLDFAGIRPLARGEQAALERKMMDENEERLMQERLHVYSFDQFRRYLDQAHPADRELVIRAMFFGKQSISSDPAQVERLFRAIAIENRGLPPLLERIFSDLYGIWTPSERIKVITNLVRNSKSQSALRGPDVVRVALGSSGVTGAKIAQVLGTHRGLLPDEYAEVVQSFKDNAQNMEKEKVLVMLEQRLERLGDDATRRAPGGEKERRQSLSQSAEVLFPKLSPARREKYVGEILALERLTNDGGIVSDIKEIGRELGSGSIGIAYEVSLKDGSTWVAKVRRPGATVEVAREFEIIGQLTEKLATDPDLKLPNLKNLVTEVRELVAAELSFSSEAEKIKTTAANVAARNRLENWIKKGGKAVVPAVHSQHAREDVILEEFIPSVSFKNLPEKGALSVSKRSLAKAVVDEAMQSLILDEFIDPDRHTGNVLQRSWLNLGNRSWSVRPVKPVWIDLGQSVRIPLATMKPLLRAGLALRFAKTEDAILALMGIFSLDTGQSQAELVELLRRGLAEAPSADPISKMINAIVKTESGGYMVHPEYAALEKTFLLLNGYSKYLPATYLFDSAQKAVFLRIRRENPGEAWKALWLGLRMKLGSTAVYPELAAELEKLGNNSTQIAPNTGLGPR